jgi:HYR domain/Secretion system C-terminal sorting domain/Concanavalin A-like lectin/glucanases superfamily
MRQNVYTSFLFTVFCVFVTSGILKAQTTLTTLPATTFSGNNSLTGPAQVTFVLRNNNATSVVLTGIGNWCTTAENNSVWQLYYTATALSGSSTNVTIAPWTLIATSAPTSVVSTGIRALNFTGLSFVIPGGTQYRFALRNTGPGNCRYSGTGAALSPNVFSGGGVDLLIGNAQVAALNVGYSGSGTGLTLTPRYFTGFVTFAPGNQPCAQNFDGVTAPALPASWSATTVTDCAGSDPWVTTATTPASSPNCAFVNEPGCVSDEVLDSRPFQIVSASAQLSFQNNYDLETTFDGMVLEISVGGGPFADIIGAGGSFVSGGYNGSITAATSPINGRQAWTGLSAGYINTTVNLPAAANGQTVVIRWRRATDNSLGGGGARIDNITLTGSDCTGAGACVITCPANITVSNTLNQCGATVTFPAPQTNGACGPITLSHASGSFFPVGITTVTASTFSGPACTFTVRVNDVQPPVVTCPANITTGNTTGLCGAVVNFSPTATDNCPGVTVSSVPASGSVFPVGTTTVTSTATDGAGNTATCSFTVTVTDTEGPAFSTPGLFPERLYYKFDGSGTSVPNLATAPPAGTTTATLTGLTQGSTGKCGGALVGTGVANQSLNTNWATNMTGSWTISFWLGPNQVDNNPSYLFGDINAGAFRCFYGGAALTNNVLLRGGSADVLISGVNPAATFITIVYNGVNTVVYKNGGSPQTYNVTFTNTGPGPFRVGGYSTLASVNGRMDEFGLYSRALTPAEVLSLFNTCPVNVNTCPANITVGNTPGSCGAVVNYTTPVAVDNCPGVTTTQTAGLPSGASFPIGTTTNNFRGTDAAGNITNCTFTVTVNDTQAPTITCPSNITVSSPVGSCNTVVNFTVNVADNCPGATVVSTPASGSTFPLGTTTVNSTATDASGNTSTCSFTVTVLDGQLPVISAQPASRTVCLGTNATFSVTASNVVTYQWQQWNGTAWVNIAGTNASTYTIPNVTHAMNTNTFRVILNGLCTVVISNPASLYVNGLPVIGLTAAPPPPLLPNQSTTITATVNPPGGTFVWSHNGSPVAGVSGPVLGPLGVDDIGTYRAVYTDLNGCISASADLVIGGLISENLWVYPNPNQGQFVVRFYNQANETATLNIYNAAGQRIYQKAFVTTTAYTRMDIDLGTRFSEGVYIVEVVNSAGKQMGARRVIIRHP